MKIGIARYPYFRQSLKGGDYILFDTIADSLKATHDVDFIEYERPMLRVLMNLPHFFSKFLIFLTDLLIPFTYTKQLLKKIDEYDLILADSSVLTKPTTNTMERKKIICLINIDYHAYLISIKKNTPYLWRAIITWKSWMQDRGIGEFKTIAVSKFVEETLSKRGLSIYTVIENISQQYNNKEAAISIKHENALVYAGSGDYFGKGLDVLEYLAGRGFEIHTYSSTNIPGCINHGQVCRERLLIELKKYGAMLFPSRYESFGLVAIEALSVGIPVIMRKTGIGVEIEKIAPECILSENAQNDEWEKTILDVLSNKTKYSSKTKLFTINYCDRKRFSNEWRTIVERLQNE